MTRTAQPVSDHATPQNGPHTCRNCGGAIFYSVSMSTGSRWIHDDTFIARCPKDRRTA